MDIIKLVQQQKVSDITSNSILVSGSVSNLSKQFIQRFNEIINTTNFKAGLPVTVPYKAISGQEVNNTKLHHFFSSLSFDIDVLKESLDVIESKVTQNLDDANTNATLLSILTSEINEQLSAELRRLEDRSLWAFSDGFFTSTNIDFNGSSNIELDSLASIVTPKLTDKSEFNLIDRFFVTTESLPNPIRGSNPNNILDLDSDSFWGFLPNESNKNAVVTFEANRGTFLNIKTATINSINAKRLTVTFTSADSSEKVVEFTKPISIKWVGLDKVVRISISLTGDEGVACGIKGLSLQTSDSVPNAVLKTKKLFTGFFSQIFLSPEVDLSGKAKIDWQYSTNGTTWTTIPTNYWVLRQFISQITKQINYNLTTVYGTLFREAVSPSGVDLNSAVLNVGKNQIEVSAVQAPKSLKLDDIPTINLFSQQSNNVCWESPANAPTINDGATSISTTVECPVLLASSSGLSPVFQKGLFLAGTTLTEKGSGLSFLPISGEKNSMIRNYCYKFTYYVNSSVTQYIDNGLYYFVQGFLEPGSRPISESTYKLGSFSMYVNDVLVAGSNIPGTIYKNLEADSLARDGTGFTFTLNQGWNKIDILIYIPPIPAQFKPANSTDYLQLTVFPEFLSTESQAKYQINEVLGSGQIKGDTIFDLTWKRPISPKYWAWDLDKSGIVFNSKEADIIDGFFGGPSKNPISLLNYQGNGEITSTDLYLRALIYGGKEFPIIDGYKIIVK